jgi:two-component system phosphate regulon sensor histidine kinase PhoR
MILLDLKLTLFVAGLALLAALAGAAWLAGRGGRRPSGAWASLDVVPFGLIVTELDDTIVFANAAARRLLRGDQEGATADLRDWVRRFDVATQPEAARSGMIHRPLPLRWWRFPLENRGALLVLADNAEHQRLVQQQQVFLGQLSHELRTPLTALVAHTALARDPRTSEPIRRSSLDTIAGETQRMARLVRDLLELHRLETADDLPLQPTDLALVAEEAIAQVILLAEERGLRLSFEADAPLRPVLAQPDRLKQVFLNLLDNAIKYCRPGDSVQVRLEARPDGARCMVRDSGPGIDAAHLPRVAERLYRARTDVEGSGLGLALIGEILRRHHTSLLIESATTGPATGTTCLWVLPYAGDAS